MARVRIELPNLFDFSTEIPVMVTDLVPGSHMGADRVLSLVLEAMARFLRDIGSTSRHRIEDVEFIMADATTVYSSEARYGDVLNIEVAVRDFERTSCNFYYRLSNSDSGHEVARVKSGLLFFDYKQKKAQPVPEAFRARFSK